MKQKKQRTLAIFALAIALVATTIAYAVLSTTLKVSGSVTKKGGTWAINIQNISITNAAKGIYCLNAATIIINKARLTNIPTAPLNFLDGDKKGTIYLKNFTTANTGKMLIGNADKLIVDNTVSY